MTKLIPEEAGNFLCELHDLLDAAPKKLDLHVPTHGTQKDLDLVRTVIGSEELYELEIWIMICRGPVLLRSPLVGFGWENSKNEPFHYRDILDGYPEWATLKWVPIANDGCGNYYVFPLTESFQGLRPVFSVYVSEDTTKLAEVVASNLLIFVKRLIAAELYEEEEDPFTREAIIQHDPAVLEIAFDASEAPHPGVYH